jgi:hypothetical protein
MAAARVGGKGKGVIEMGDPGDCLGDCQLVLTPPAVDELELAGCDELLDEGARRVVLLLPPHGEEGLLDVCAGWEEGGGREGVGRR